jgi:hypothetical protein
LAIFSSFLPGLKQRQGHRAAPEAVGNRVSHLFHAPKLTAMLTLRGLKVGVATSVRKESWDKAEIYPEQRNQDYILSDELKKMQKRQ